MLEICFYFGFNNLNTACDSHRANYQGTFHPPTKHRMAAQHASVEVPKAFFFYISLYILTESSCWPCTLIAVLKDNRIIDRNF